jgi:type IV pilus assembly protein PilV
MLNSVNHPLNSKEQRGAALVEAMVSLLIIAFGILGFVGLQARTAVGNLEAYQRSQAVLLVQNMAERIRLNHAEANLYEGVIEPTDPVYRNCPTTPGREQDICHWAGLLLGTAEREGATNIGGILAPRGCIANIGADTVLVTVVWQGIQETSPPAITCGPEYPIPRLRRATSMLVRFGVLT